MLVSHFDVEVDKADTPEETLEKLQSASYDLVLINRKLDIDYSDGMVIVRAIKEDPELAAVPVMLVTNYPEHQQEAVRAGAVEGFGKLALNEPQTIERLAAVLGD
ncbi:MAG: transcriptional regulator [Pirellulaceae bacterium]|nr:MAG: transcriptional regulator [Pirellulaceae bacterium]